MDCVKPIFELPLSPAGILCTTSKGMELRIRPVRDGDAPGLQEAYLRLSDQSKYNRFFQVRPTLNDQLASSLTAIDHENHYAWVVFEPNAEVATDDVELAALAEESGLAIASARLIRDKGDPQVAEAALALVDAYQGRGIGRFLIELLVRTAADVGVHTLRFEVLRTNKPMIGLISGAGATRHAIPGDATVVEYRLDIPEPTAVDIPIGALYELLRMSASGWE